MLNAAGGRHGADIDLEAATLIQATWRGYHARHAYLEMRGSAMVIQAWVRMFIWRLWFTRQRNAAIRIQVCSMYIVCVLCVCVCV